MSRSAPAIRAQSQPRRRLAHGKSRRDHFIRVVSGVEEAMDHITRDGSATRSASCAGSGSVDAFFHGLDSAILLPQRSNAVRRLRGVWHGRGDRHRDRR